MTGFSAVNRECAAGSVRVELRSVNSRFLDLSFRAPDELRHCEWPLRERIIATVQRGKLECRISYRPASSGTNCAHLNEAALAALTALSDSVRASIPDASAPTVIETLRWPGVLAENDATTELGAAVQNAGTEAIEAFMAHRAREGARLVAFILDRASAIRLIVEGLRQRGPELLSSHERKLTERLTGVVESLGPSVPLEETLARVRQEIALYGMRADVTEELDRLINHLDELQIACEGPGPVGKRLDFLLQELNREANTLGSKAAIIDLSRAAVELKLLIEQIREQVQNLE
jgi:uncharacterized protein (TIGR00255 family)